MIPIQLKRDDEHSLQFQIYEQIKKLINDGTLQPGTFLPSTRHFCKQYSIGRNTVIQAYDVLLSEGYVEAVRGRGTRVSQDLCDENLVGEEQQNQAPDAIKATINPNWDGLNFRLPEIEMADSVINFAPGKINPENFPTKIVEKFGNNALSLIKNPLSQYSEISGISPLRAAIAEHLSVHRGMKADPDSIIVTHGTQEALNLVARLFVSQGTKVGVENPCYQGAALAFKSCGADIVPLDVDDDGLIAGNLETFAGNLLYLTPSHQFPTGSTLSIERRKQVIDWARRTGSHVIEDDYDSDYRYDSPPLYSLAGLDQLNSVIYIGTVSKSLGPGFRIGFIVAPSHLTDAIMRAKAISSLSGQFIEQKIVTYFFESGSYQRQVRRIRQAYQNNRDIVLERIAYNFPEIEPEIWGSDAGMHFMWLLPDHFPSADTVARRASKLGVRVHTTTSAGAVDFNSRFSKRGLIIGYSSMSPSQAKSGIDVVSDAIRGGSEPA